MHEHIKNMKFLNNTAFLAFLMFPFFKPGSLYLIAPSVENFFDLWRVLSFTITIIIYFFYGRASKIIVAISIYEGMLLLSTVLNFGDYWRLSVACGTVIGSCMLTELCVKHNCRKFLSTVFWIYFVLITINFIVLLIYPNGIANGTYYRGNTYNFLGIDNALAVEVTLPLMSVSCIYSAFKRCRLTVVSILLIVIISATVLITWSATGVVAWFVLFVYILFIYKSRLTKYFNSYILFSAFIIFQILFVFLRVQEHFAFIIENILKKTVTFTGRTNVWDQTYMVIAQSPFYGHGIYEGPGLVRLNGIYYYAHNAVLEILVQSGVIGLILYIVIFVMAARQLYRYREHFIAGIITVTLFSFLITFLMEAQITSVWIYGFLTMAYNVSGVIGQYEEYVLHTRPMYVVFKLRNFRIQLGR